MCTRMRTCANVPNTWKGNDCTRIRIWFGEVDGESSEHLHTRTNDDDDDDDDDYQRNYMIMILWCLRVWA